MTTRMARLVAAFTIISMTFVSVIAPSASAANFFPGDSAVVTADYLNLRSNPGLDGKVRDVLLSGDELEILEGPKSDDGLVWYKVRALEIDLLGWVSEDFIAYSPTDNGGSESSFDGAPGAKVVDGPVNVREAPGLDAQITSTLDTGREVPTYAGSGQVESADGYDWLRILYGNGIQGWVATDYLTPLDYSPNLGSDDGWSTAEGVKVVEGPVNLRLEPSLDGGIFDTADTGDIINRWSNSDLVNADGYVWIKLKSFASADPLWAAIVYLSPVAEMPCTDGACYPDELNDFFGAQTAVVVDGPVNMRSGPSTSAGILITLENGDYLFGLELVYSEGGDPVESNGHFWVFATAGGYEGYVAIDFLDPVT